MEIRLNSRFIISIFCGVLLLSGCGGRQEVRSARQDQAAEFNQRAQRSFQRGEYQAAADLYESALRQDVAIENVNGIAINTLNLARVNHVLGKNALAQRYLDQLLDDKALRYATVHLAEAAVRKSLLLLEGNDIAGSVALLGQAADWCASGCTFNGAIDNVRAGIALRENDAEKALHWGERAASANRNVPMEYANSLRLIATARLMKNEHDASLRLSDEALAIDKSLGLPEKIRQDLLLSAQAHEKLGHAEQAAQYRDRAERIAAAVK